MFVLDALELFIDDLISPIEIEHTLKQDYLNLRTPFE